MKQKKKNITVTGIDLSPAMVKQAQENYPMIKDRFIEGDVLSSNLFPMRTFTHICCFYFTIYYLENKDTFFQNCFDWLQPGGLLFVHLVDPEKFDPILPPGNPLFIVSPQRYAKERITRTKIHFKEFEYQSNFQYDASFHHPSSFVETFSFPNQPKRIQEHIFYMQTMESILAIAQEVGFIVKGKIDLMKVAYDNQYMYLFIKPT
jgi:SAM-dependent methyltransferase